MKNKVIVFSVFLASILSVSYGIAADESDYNAEKFLKIAQSYFRGDYELTKEYFIGMPVHVRAELPSIYGAMENMLEPSADDCFQPEDFQPKFEEFFSLIEHRDWRAVASLAITLKRSYEKEWPECFQKVALMAIEEHAQHEVTKARSEKTKARMLATYRRSVKENAVPITTQKSKVLVLSSSPFKGKVPTGALANATNTEAKQ